MAEVTTVGVDLSKEVIVVCAADARGRTLHFKQLSFCGILAVGREPSAVRHRHGGLQLGAPLGSDVIAARAYTAPDGRRARGTVSHEPRGQERSQRCPGHCRGGGAAEHALCHPEVSGPAGHARLASSQVRVCRGTHGAAQPHPGHARRVRHLDRQIQQCAGAAPA